MSQPEPLRHEESITIEASPESVYDLVSDVTRTGEWSPVCRQCWWEDDAAAGQVGSWFTGRNELPDRTWETRSKVVAADRGRKFAWAVGGDRVRWGYTLTPAGTGTILTESWDFLPGGIAYFEEKFGDDAPAQIADRTRLAHVGIPKTLAAIKQIAESELFPHRLDHLYIVRAASSSGSEVIYVGKTTRPGRALEHWIGASNARLASAVDRGFSGKKWPEILTIPLPVPSWEDLAIYETTLIDLFKNDRRFECVNGTAGDEIFRPRSAEGSNYSNPRSIEQHWEAVGEDAYELSDVPTSSSRRWVTAPLAHKENGERLREVLRKLALDGVDAFGSWAMGWPPFFGFLGGFGIEGRGHTLPWIGKMSTSDLRAKLGSSFMLVSVTGMRFDDEEGVRPGFGIQIDEPVLRERASRFWAKSSSSHPKVFGKTLSTAQLGEDKPKFLLAVSGRKGHYAIVGGWPIAKKEWQAHKFEHDTKIEFPLIEPRYWQEADGKILKNLIGTQLRDELNWYRKGALWCL